MKMLDVATIKGCKDYFKEIVDSVEANVEKLDDSSLAFSLACNSVVRFLGVLQIYQKKYGKLSLEDYANYSEVE